MWLADREAVFCSFKVASAGKGLSPLRVPLCPKNVSITASMLQPSRHIHVTGVSHRCHTWHRQQGILTSKEWDQAD